jgi:hypothetical protein
MQWPANSNAVISGASDTGLRRLRNTPRIGLSDAGISFLKCTFAPPDFQQNSVSGVPDEFRGGSLVRKHRFVGTQVFVANFDYYYILAPVPGFSYFLLVTAAGVAPTAASVWTGVPYADFPGMFGSSPANNADNVTKFRYISNHIEVIPTVNQMIWTGNIQAWKFPLNLVTRQGGTGPNDLYSVEGLSSVNTSLSNQYSAPFIQGLYSACYNSNCVFEFQNILENIVTVPNVIGGSDFGALASGTIGLPGLDNQFESLVIKITGITAGETAILKTWACVEYQVNSNSTLYEFQSLSPHDPMALNLYREIITNLPVGVPFDQNESFWTRVLGIINQISGFGSALPGPYGLASRGVNLLSSAGLQFLR